MFRVDGVEMVLFKIKRGTIFNTQRIFNLYETMLYTVQCTCQSTVVKLDA